MSLLSQHGFKKPTEDHTAQCRISGWLANIELLAYCFALATCVGELRRKNPSVNSHIVHIWPVTVSVRITIECVWKFSASNFWDLEGNFHFKARV